METLATSYVFLVLFVVHVTCINYYECKPKKCEVRARTEAGWACGRLREAEDGSLYASFRGLPYGQPPLGELRFKELQPVKPWDDCLLDASEDAPACPQTDVIYGRMPLQPCGQSEDCMYLNLHMPHKAVPQFPWKPSGHGLPIVVFIHGGAFQSGSGLTDVLGPEYMMMMMKKVIVITFNFRLNVFGFFCLHTKEIPGNQGFRDMVSLLRWVQRNARYFGGDPDNVTLMGQSGGATSAHILALSKSTKGLFKRLILMSCTAFPSFYTTSASYTKEVNDMFLRELGIKETDPVLIHKALTRIPLLKIMHANTAVQLNTTIVSFNPVIERPFAGTTTILDADPMQLMAEGRARDIPILMSYTNNEAASLRWSIAKKSKLLLPIVKHDVTAIVSPRLVHSLPSSEVQRIADLIDYKYFNGKPTLDGLLAYFTDMIFKHPALKVAQWRAAMKAAPTYIYQFAYDTSFSPVKAAEWLDYRGAGHMDDLACVFRVNSMLGCDYLSSPPKNKDDYMKYWMTYLITNFAICSNPTCNNNAVWPPISEDVIQYNLISSPMRIHIKQPTAKVRDMVKFFDSFDSVSRDITKELGAACLSTDSQTRENT